MLKKIGTNARYEIERLFGLQGEPEALGEGEKRLAANSDILIKNFGYKEDER